MSSIQEQFLMNKVWLPPIVWERDLSVHKRINLVVDTLENHYVFGGVATTVIFATLLARRNNLRLRIITRTSTNNAQVAYYDFLKSVKIDAAPNVEFVNIVPFGSDNKPLAVSQYDIFIATSWWSAYLISRVTSDHYFHIIQEDETVFYNNGDEAVFCEQVLALPRVKYIVNSKILFDYFKRNHFNYIAEKGVYFEPVFPAYLFAPQVPTFQQKDTYKLFFYARPNTQRNLYQAGLRIIDTAIEQGILDTNRWTIYFAGESFEPIPFSDGTMPVMVGKMNWEEYTSFLKEIDLGFSLLWSPHPGYIPMDIAAAGGISISNTYRDKTVEHYSPNIICGDIIKPDFVARQFKEAVLLAENMEQRKENFMRTNLAQDWNVAFSDSFTYVEEEMINRGIIENYGTI